MVALVAFRDLAPMLRNRPEIRNMVTPANLLVSTVRALRQQAIQLPGAHEGPATISRSMAAVAASNARPVLFVFVVGETARAANFSLNGYARDTNPELAKLDIINFHVRAPVERRPKCHYRACSRRRPAVIRRGENSETGIAPAATRTCRDSGRMARQSERMQGGVQRFGSTYLRQCECARAMYFWPLLR